MEKLKRQLCAAVSRNLAGGRQAPPEAGFLLWRAFGELSRARCYGAAGPEAIRYTEIEAWGRLMRVPLEPHNVEILTAMDEAWLQASASRSTATAPAKPRGPLSPAMFDAVFG